MSRRSIAVFSSVVFFAMLVAAYGFLGLYFDANLVAESESTGRGIFIFISTILTFLIWQLSQRDMHVLTRAIITGTSVFLVMAVANGVWQLFETGSFAQFTIGIGKFALNPLTIATAGIAFLGSLINEAWVRYERGRKDRM